MKLTMPEIRLIAQKCGFCDVTTKKDKNGMWLATAKRTGLAIWHETYGNTRTSSLNSLVDEMRRFFNES